MTLWLLVGFCLLASLVISLVLVQHYIKESGSLLSKLCSQGKKADCRAILDSKQSKFFNIPHADIGIAYFGGCLILLILSQSIPWTVSLLSLIAVIYSFYSIICQKLIIKQWCSLCLIAQFFIILQSVIIIANYEQLSFKPDSISSLLLTLFAFGLASGIWFAIRHYLVSQNGNKEKNDDAKSQLLSKATIKAIQKQKGIEIEEYKGDILIQDNVTGLAKKKKGSPWHVIVGISPSCVHCGEFLESLISLIEKDQLPIKLRIRFVTFAGDDQDAINDQSVAEHTIALAVNDGLDAAAKALRSWYNNYGGQDLQGWLSSLRSFSDQEINSSGVYMADNSFWLQEKDITETPALYIEDYEIAPEQSSFAPELLHKLCEKP